MSIKYFGIEATYNPFANAEDLQQVSSAIFNIADEPNFATTYAVSVSTGLVPSAISFLSTDFSATILDADGTTLLQILKAKLGSIGNNEYPQVDEIVWFDVEGMQSAFWIHSDYLGKQLKISGKFQTTAITGEFLNKEIRDEIYYEVFNRMYPIGSVYSSYSNKAPTMGTWRRTAHSRVLVGLNEGDGSFNTSRETGGAKTHKLSVAQMPRHSHSTEFGSHSHSTGGSTGKGAGWSAGSVLARSVGGSTGFAYLGNKPSNYVGGNGAHNNLQPYITVYMFERIA